MNAARRMRRRADTADPNPADTQTGKPNKGREPPAGTHTQKRTHKKPGGGEEARVIRKRRTEAGCNPPGRKARGIAGASLSHNWFLLGTRLSCF